MNRYPLELKQEMVKKLCSPNGPSAYQLSAETGISTGSLYKWVQKFSGEGNLKKNLKPDGWSPKEKLKAVFETEDMNEQELGEFLRSKGLHSHTLAEWKEEAFSALASSSKGVGRPKKDKELVSAQKEIKDLKRDLNRKNKALAEQSAIIILQKKAQHYLLEDEDEE